MIYSLQSDTKLVGDVKPPAIIASEVGVTVGRWRSRRARVISGVSEKQIYTVVQGTQLDWQNDNHHRLGRKYSSPISTHIY